MKSSLQSRRRFLVQAGSAVAGALPDWPLRVRAATLSPPVDGEYRAVVYLFLGGGHDSFNLLVPFTGPSATAGDAYAEYAASRGSLALARKDLLEIRPLNTDGRSFGVHPSMPRLAALFESRHAAFIANVGTLVERVENRGQVVAGSKRLPRGLQSHPDQTEQWQTAVPSGAPAVGWGGRVMELIQSAEKTVPMNLSMDGRNVFQSGVTRGELAVDPAGGAIQRTGYVAERDPADEVANATSTALDELLGRTRAHPLEEAFRRNQQEAGPANALYAAATAAPLPGNILFPDTPLGRQLRQVAKAIHGRAALGMPRQTFYVHRGGWDHHADALPLHAAMLREVDDAIGAFWDQLVAIGLAAGEPVEGQVTLFSGSEFGRTLAGNGRGSEHGWGGNQFVVGGSVDGGKIHGSYPGLALNPDDGTELNPLDLGRGRLIPTTACDEYFGELALWLGVPEPKLPQVLPNLANLLPPGTGLVPLGFLGAPGAPVNTSPPVLRVDGVGHTVEPGAWTGTPQEYGYQWYRNGTRDDTQTGSTYAGTLVAGDELYCLVTATNPKGTKAARSNPWIVPGAPEVMVYWTDRSDNESGFRFEWGTDGVNFPNVVTVAAQVTTTLIAFPGPGIYYGRIKAYNPAGESAPGNVLIIPVQT